MVKNREQFLKKIDELKTYIVQFNENDAIRKKKYSLNCTVR